ncbi:MAG: PAS domain S-box protein, partial [Peptococcaceae bacterium]|nr:PAS domain S-box protein [Peptococcaceae bacterium]
MSKNELLDTIIFTVLFIPALYLFLYRPMRLYLAKMQAAESELQEINSKLELRVLERTAELEQLNQLLQEEYIESLRLSEEKYKSVVDGLGVGVALIGHDMSLITVNQQLVSWFPGIDRKSGAKCHEILNICPPGCVDCPASQTFADGKIREMLLHQQVNGETRNFRVVVSPAQDAYGKLDVATLLVEDVTETIRVEERTQKLNRELELDVQAGKAQLLATHVQLEQRIYELEQTQLALRKSEKRYRNIIETANEGIWITDQNTKITFINHKMAQMLGYDDEDLLNQSISDFVEVQQADVLGSLDVQQPGLSQRVEARFLRQDGGIMWAIVTTNPLFDDAGRFSGTLGMVTDITDRREAEQVIINSRNFYLGLFEEFPEPIWRADVHGKADYFNKMRLQFGGKTLEQEIGDGWQAMLHPDDVEAFVALYHAAIEKRVPFNSEYRALRHDGEYRWIVDHGIPFHGLDGKFAGYVGAMYDVTELKQSEESLKQSYQNLKLTLNETVNALVNVSEIRDPYTAGHQHRVAKLACALARQMGLSDKQIEGIEVAGKLHDIGKIYVPTDILNKPGRLTEIEMGLIRSHPEVGYEIIKAIPFEYAVANMVIQHHERLDGSGYPKGLK